MCLTILDVCLKPQMEYCLNKTIIVDEVYTYYAISPPTLILQPLVSVPLRYGIGVVFRPELIRGEDFQTTKISQ